MRQKDGDDDDWKYKKDSVKKPCLNEGLGAPIRTWLDKCPGIGVHQQSPTV